MPLVLDGFGARRIRQKNGFGILNTFFCEKYEKTLGLNTGWN